MCVYTQCWSTCLPSMHVYITTKILHMTLHAAPAKTQVFKCQYHGHCRTHNIMPVAKTLHTSISFSTHTNKQTHVHRQTHAHIPINAHTDRQTDRHTSNFFAWQPASPVYCNVTLLKQGYRGVQISAVDTMAVRHRTPDGTY